MSNRPSSEQPVYGEPFVEVTRGDLVESVHRVAACVLDVAGNVVYALGEIDRPVYLRSSAKPFIAAAVLAAGVRERFGLDDREIAVMAASHTGQTFHVNAVRSILKKIGLPEAALQCGMHIPYNEESAIALQRGGHAPTAVYNNCSGKHAGILALCLSIGAPVDTYLDTTNPAQRQILAFCARMSGVEVNDLRLAVDGCGIPVYATPLRNAALSFARLATLEGIAPADAAALEAVRDAMVRHPAYVSGTGEFDTRLMEAADGAIAAKSGAEGFHGAAAVGRAGLALKVADGNSRARGPAVLKILRELGLLSPAAAKRLADVEEQTVYNRAGRAVGVIRNR